MLLASLGAVAAKIVDEASAIEAAKRYTKAKCTTQAPCAFKARREGKQWNVWVQFPKQGHVVLYFDAEGSLVRRIEGE